MGWRRGAAVAVAVVLAACSGGEHHAAPAAAGACTAEGARALVARFLAGGDVDASVAPKGTFKWFSAPDRVGQAASDRSTLAAYLAGRRRQATPRLDAFSFNGVAGGHANFDFTIAETAAAGTVRYPGKGAIDCVTGTIMVWSEGTPA